MSAFARQLRRAAERTNGRRPRWARGAVLPIVLTWPDGVSVSPANEGPELVAWFARAEEVRRRYRTVTALIPRETHAALVHEALAAEMRANALGGQA